MIGTKLAHYEITSHLGSGGMGEVYRATDTKLGRSVAIKFLPEAFSHDTERVARFQREARVLASLNHPNIAAIHGLEEIDSRHFLVMELVPGETLADRIERGGAIPFDEALPIAKQIAEGLEAAHEQGIIHRDLKPANIKLRPDGTVKVLDFGLAKALEPVSAAGADATTSPTITSPAMVTGVGILLGTAAYMSPEQARGKTVDKRSDVWAFGCVLYEMVTNRRPFEGEDITEVLGAVVRLEPDWVALPADISSAIRSLLRRCLSKDPKRRLRDIADARIELEDVLSGAGREIGSSAAEQRVPTRWREGVAWVTAVAGVSAALFFGFNPTPTPPSRDLVRLSILPPEKTSFSGSPSFTVNVPQFEVSPDGRAIIFVAAAAGARPTLWRRTLDSVVAQSLAGTEGAEFPFWSPDSRWVGFFADGQLKKVSAVGGPVQPIADAPDPRPGSWGPHDTIIFSRGITGILKVSSSGGLVEPVFELDASRQEGQHRFPQFLPDGTHFLFTVRSSIRDYNGVYVGSLDGRTKKLLVSGAATIGGQTAARYSSGYLFFLNGDALMAQPFDTGRLELTAQPFLVEAGIGRSSSGSGAYSLSDAGTLAYAGMPSEASRLVWFDRVGKPSGSVATQGDWRDVRLSP